MSFKRILTFFLFILLITSYVLAQNPKDSWQQYATPEEAGFSSKKISLLLMVAKYPPLVYKLIKFLVKRGSK